jgi:GT2 family glycosyltransferase
LKIVVIDDGSTDGTESFLASQSDVLTVKGNGSLWWGGAIDLGIRTVSNVAALDDWVLFVNNDTHIKTSFVQSLLKTARRLSPAAVGSAVRQDHAPYKLLSIGPIVDAWRFLMEDALRLDNMETIEQRSGTHYVDALSGRGVLYPFRALQRVGGMRPKWLPHYLADYEVSLRVRAAGWRLVVDSAVAVYSRDEYGNTNRGNGLRARFFAVRSPSYLPAQIGFWWHASTVMQKTTLPLRLLLISLFPSIRKKK